MRFLAIKTISIKRKMSKNEPCLFLISFFDRTAIMNETLPKQPKTNKNNAITLRALISKCLNSVKKSKIISAKTHCESKPSDEELIYAATH